ncbi:MAG: redox-regulated ATPase YchF [Candidatus Andersenbacteria bacterium RIFCSPHIGHO2_12_FULL_45_11b]|uniref:Ribosome-binding ATPase YchF n=1 Tax=Candidatus Andersenbacteria bacterium RIFCSPHIGHO2_12_FULL_45_11b TaxID=1797282 RepID=A0A1G1X6Q0_9BACT|nr:MAG: redox-regulated ATPase YchF [Candidatus Andersenbacteria bacterium RIFCSPHIGHO2_12_FULL_45_11b]
MLRVGIVGLPNVGKSTLFNALTKQAAAARNVPFTTIEPNVGVVPVPDERLEKLRVLSESAKVVPTTIEFVDIAGLVKDAHKGEGLGNKFLSHIREVDAIVHVVRFFNDADIIHVANKVDPAGDAETINTELALADLATTQKLIQNAEKIAKGQGVEAKEATAQLAVLKKIEANLEQGLPARDVELTDKERELVQTSSLLTTKPMMYVANVSDPAFAKASAGKRTDTSLEEFEKKFGTTLPLTVKIEQEIAQLSPEEQEIFLAEYGLTETGLNRLIKAGYELLGLITFFTTGPQETRAWTIKKGSMAPVAAGEIHSDMQRGFIRAETVAYSDLTTLGGYAAARAAGKVRDEGKTYVVADGDIFVFKFSV